MLRTCWNKICVRPEHLRLIIRDLSTSRICAHCGKSFDVDRPSQRKRFCSHVCADTANRIPIEDRFWSRVQKTESCWLWTGAQNGVGYGSLGRQPKDKGGRTIYAHRLSWELHNGPIPPGLFVCHNCPGGDNRLCVRPDHLFLGTLAENQMDMVRKGRSVKGRKFGSTTKLKAYIRTLNDRLAAYAPTYPDDCPHCSEQSTRGKGWQEHEQDCPYVPAYMKATQESYVPELALARN